MTAKTSDEIMVKEKSWQEFRNTGLVLFINQILHVFGWALTFETDEKGNAIRCYPGRVKFRGFSNDLVDINYKKIAKYMHENSKELMKEAMED